MTDTGVEDEPTHTFYFIRGVDGDAGECEWPVDVEKVRQALGESLNARNVAFLLGAGCSSSVVERQEVGVPTMAPLAQEFTKTRETDDPLLPDGKKERELTVSSNLGLTSAPRNIPATLERLMELLFSLRFALQRSSLDRANAQLKIINTVIGKVQTFLWTKCTQGAFANSDNTVMTLCTSLSIESSFFAIDPCRVLGSSPPTTTCSMKRPWIASVCPTQTAFLVSSKDVSTRRHSDTPLQNSWT